MEQVNHNKCGGNLGIDALRLCSHTPDEAPQMPEDEYSFRGLLLETHYNTGYARYRVVNGDNLEQYYRNWEDNIPYNLSHWWYLPEY